jgi:hypothetical protein
VCSYEAFVVIYFVNPYRGASLSSFFLMTVLWCIIVAWSASRVFHKIHFSDTLFAEQPLVRILTQMN